MLISDNSPVRKTHFDSSILKDEHAKILANVLLLIWKIVGQGPGALAVSADKGCLDVFSLANISHFLSPLSARRTDMD